MDLLLTHGFFLAEDAAEQRIMRPHPPLGILYLSSHLKARGVDVGVFDGTFQQFADFEHCLRQHRPAVVGIAVNLMTKRLALRMMTAARAAGARVVVGGPDPPHYAEEYLHAGADVVVIGEGEQTLEELLPILARDMPEELSRVPGIAFADRSGGGSGGGTVPVISCNGDSPCHRLSRTMVARTAPRPLIENLDAQPLPDRGAVDLGMYLAAWRRHHGFAPVSLITARGCPYSCAWCSRSVFGTTHRRRSVTNVADEVEHITARYAPDRLWYADDVFAIHRTWTLDYARELQRRRIRLPFECISRAERIDDEVADALVELGCWRVWIGSESGSQRILDAMQRRVDVDRVVAACDRLRRRRIQVGMFIMLGYDGEDERDLRATIAHLKRAAPDIFLTTVSYPIKGTPYYDAVVDRLQTDRSWDARTDRDWVIAGRPSPRYYECARRWMVGEVESDRHWQAGRYLRATRAAASAWIGRAGMAIVGDRPVRVAALDGSVVGSRPTSASRALAAASETGSGRARP